MTKTHLLLVPLLTLASGCQSDPVRLDSLANSCGSQNLLRNGDFEAGSDTMPDAWQITSHPKANFHWDQNVAHTGQASGLIEVEAGHLILHTSFAWFQDVMLASTGYDHCEFRGWIKTQDLSETASLIVQYLDPDGETIGAVTSQGVLDLRGTSDWTAVRVRFAAPASSAGIRVSFGFSAPVGGGGKAWFDDFEVSAPVAG